MKKDIVKFNNSTRIVNILMLKSFFESNIGLFEGQMGVVITMAEIETLIIKK